MSFMQTFYQKSVTIGTETGCELGMELLAGAVPSCAIVWIELVGFTILGCYLLR